MYNLRDPRMTKTHIVCSLVALIIWYVIYKIFII
nr:MAG TPA: Protein of unknown function (DUF1467) [Caudoviricetes sp.]